MYCLHDLDVNVELHLLAEPPDDHPGQGARLVNLCNKEDVKQNFVEIDSTSWSHYCKLKSFPERVGRQLLNPSEIKNPSLKLLWITFTLVIKRKVD